MKRQAVWIENDHTYVYEILENNFEKVKITNHSLHHHAHHDKDTHSHNTKYFNEIAEHLKNHEVVLMGHAQLKGYFNTFLKEHHPDIYKKVAALVSADKLTDNQILAKAKEAFQQYEMDQALKR